MKKFPFSWTAFAVTIISLFLFSACNKQNSIHEEVTIEDEIAKYKDYEKFVSPLRLTTKDASEIIDSHSKLELTGSEKYNAYIKEISSLTPEKLIEKQNRAITNTLKNISKFSVEKLEKLIESRNLRRENFANPNLREDRDNKEVAKSRSCNTTNYMQLTAGGSIFGMPSGGILLGDYGFAGNTVLFTEDVFFPATILKFVSSTTVFLDFAHPNSGFPTTCYDGLYFTLAFQQPSTLSSRSAFYFGSGGYWGGASLEVPASGDLDDWDNWSLNTVANAPYFCSEWPYTEPVFRNLGKQTGCIGTNYTVVAAPQGTLCCQD